MKTLLFFSILLLTLVGCENKQLAAPKPADFIAFDQMVDVYADLHIAEEMSQINIDPDRPIREVFIKNTLGVLKKHGISKEQFYANHHYYLDRPELFSTLSDSVTAHLKFINKDLIHKAEYGQ